MSQLVTLFLLLILIALAANTAEHARSLGRERLLPLFVAYGSTTAVHLALFGSGILLQFVGVAQRSNAFDLAQLEALAAQAGVDAQALQTLLQETNFTLIGFGLWMPSLVGLLLLLEPVRRLVGRALPRIEPANTLHAVALSLSTLVLTNLLLTLGVGLESLTDSLATGEFSSTLLTTAWLQNVLILLLSVIGVGWLTRCSLDAAMERLKIAYLSKRQFLIGVGSGLGMIVLIAGLVALGQALGANTAEVDELSEALYGPFFQSIGGILTVGVAAAIGEETLFRGALQPRFGRLLTALLFGLLHGNYGLSVITLGIVIVGYLLGVLRDRFNTTTAMVAHGTFNTIQALGAYVVAQEAAAAWLPRLFG